MLYQDVLLLNAKYASLAQILEINSVANVFNNTTLYFDIKTSGESARVSFRYYEPRYPTLICKLSNEPQVDEQFLHYD